MLFALEAGHQSVEQVIASYWRETPGDPEGREYADRAVRGVVANMPELDQTIQQASQNWRLARMARVDRNVLRLGTWELVHASEVPGAVVLDEAVELAKRYGTQDSGSFVNGVLDRVASEHARV